MPDWAPIEVDQIQPLLGTFDKWCLCGGKSLDVLVGRTTREHGDTDIGVFRSDLEECLTSIGASRVFFCDAGRHIRWDGSTVPSHIHDIWIASADGLHWILQILVFSDDAERVYYKRDRSIHWPKQSQTSRVDGYRILNPLITLLYKANRSSLEEGDLQDVRLLIEELRLDHE